jgi:hypothetical protein
MTLTPVEGMQWIYDDIYLKGKSDPESNISVIEVDMLDNPYLHQGEVQEFVNSLNDDDKEARVHGKFVQRGGLVYKDFDRAVHVVDFFVPPKDWLWISSLDHGYNNPTAWLWHAVSPDGRVVTFKEHYESKMVVSEHAKVVHQINQQNGRPPEQYIGDPSIRNTDPITGTSIQQEYVKYGIPVTLGNNDVGAGIERVSSYLKKRKDGTPNWVITKNCTSLIYEMGRYTWKTWASKKVEGQNNAHETARKRDDHALDSARYFFMSRPSLAASVPGLGEKPVNILNVPAAVSPSGMLAGQEFSSVDITTEWDLQSLDPDMGGYF